MFQEVSRNNYQALSFLLLVFRVYCTPKYSTKSARLTVILLSFFPFGGLPPLQKLPVFWKCCNFDTDSRVLIHELMENKVILRKSNVCPSQLPEAHSVYLTTSALNLFQYQSQCGFRDQHLCTKISAPYIFKSHFSLLHTISVKRLSPHNQTSPLLFRPILH